MANQSFSEADYLNQILTLQTPDGEMQFGMSDLQYYVYYALRICINLGTQIGASAALLIVLILLTRADKRCSTIFIINAIALPMNIIRIVLGACYYTGPFYDPYRYFSNDFSSVPRTAFGVPIAASVFTLLLLILVEASLIFQIRIASVTVREIERFWLMVVSISVAMVAIGFRFPLVVVSSKATLDLQSTIDFGWLASATNITTTISICFFCAIFLFKLGLAIHQRRKLGIRKFGPMQAIFIMGCQTLLVPGKYPPPPHNAICSRADRIIQPCSHSSSTLAQQSNFHRRPSQCARSSSRSRPCGLLPHWMARSQLSHRVGNNS